MGADTEDIDKKAHARIAAWLEREAEQHDARNRVPYDGILGEPPEWFPGIHRHNFTFLRNRVLDRPLSDGSQPTPQLAKKWIDAYLSGGQWPEEISVEIGLLAQLYSAYRMGCENGQKLLLGRDYNALQLGKRQQEFISAGGKARVGKYGPARQMVEAVKPNDWAALLAVLKEYEDDDFGLPQIRRFVVQEVDDDKEIVCYLWDEQQQEPVSFKTLQNHIANLK